MRIIQLTSNDAKTGGAIAVTRLQNSLQKFGHTSQILSYSDVSVSESIHKVTRSLWWRSVDAASRRLNESIGLQGLTRPSSFLLWKEIKSFRPDIIHLHWIYGGGYIPLSMLFRLSNQYPLIWTFHDMHAFTGGCTNSLDCYRWLDKCGSCPQWRGGIYESSMPPLMHDTTSLLWRLKKYVYKKSQFSIIGPSRWITDLARQSPLLKEKRIYHLFNGLDTDQWKPMDKRASKIALGIDPEKKVLLFVGKPDKVFAYPGRRFMLTQIIESLRCREENFSHKYVLLLVGEGAQDFIIDGCEIVAVGSVGSPSMLRICYNSADLLLDPTQFDNLPSVIQEALACGIPVIASNVGGIPDLVFHKKNGYIAGPNAVTEFVDGILGLLSSDSIYDRFSYHARQYAVENYSSAVIIEKLLEIYQETIANKSERHKKLIEE